MRVNANTITYNFGPCNNLKIKPSNALEKAIGNFDNISTNWRMWLQFQIFCHAIHQINNGESQHLKIEKIEDVKIWEPSNPGDPFSTPIEVEKPLTYATYNVIYDKRTVLSVKESFDYDFIITYFDPREDKWMDYLCDWADEHCKCFGRM